MTRRQDDIAGRGDPIKTLLLMWGRVDAPRRGPKSKVAVADLVMAAVRLADAEGIEAVSTRRVAEAVGISPMSFLHPHPRQGRAWRGLRVGRPDRAFELGLARMLDGLALLIEGKAG